jgi:TFIIH basal transcription factor complex TTD-A subunit
MPRAIRGKISFCSVIYAMLISRNPGVLVECDPSIKSIIVKIDSEEHAFIVEDLDDQTLVIKENMLSILKMRLDEVRAFGTAGKGRGLMKNIGFEGNAATA